jgi:hypothetical protein
MQEEEPQIQRSGKLPGAGTLEVKSMRSAAGYSGASEAETGSGVIMALAVGTMTEAMGKAINVLRFIWFTGSLLKRDRRRSLATRLG